MVVLARRGADVISWPLSWAARPGLAAVDELARWQLAARRLGWSIRLRGSCADLSELLDLVGLSDVLPGLARLCREVEREAEGAEQGRVDEIVMPDDPVA